MNRNEIIDLLNRTKNVRIVKIETNKIVVDIIKGSNKRFSIPCKLSNDLAYLVAAIICDGHIRKDKYRIMFEITNKKIFDNFSQKICNVFDIKPKYKLIIDKRKDRKPRYRIDINGKPIIVFLNYFFDIPRGKKSNSVKVPSLINKSTKKIKKAFIQGVFDTDGGKRHRGWGLSSKSIMFRDGIFCMLSEFGFDVRKDEWINKKYNLKYYGLYFKNSRGGSRAVKGAGLLFS